MRDADGDGSTGAESVDQTGDSSSARSVFNAEIERTAFQRKAVSRLPVAQVLDLAATFFRDRGYRVGRTGRPGQLFVMGPAEGALPRVTGEVNAQADVGKARTTLIRLDAAGERLGPAMADFHALLRAQRKPNSAATDVVPPA
jgi:hypothetical protein